MKRAQNDKPCWKAPCTVKPRTVLLANYLCQFLHVINSNLWLNIYTKVTKICRTELVPWDFLPCYSTGFSSNLCLHVSGVYLLLLSKAGMRRSAPCGGCAVEYYMSWGQE